MIWKDFSQNVSTEKDFLVYRDNNEKKHKKFVWHFRLTVKLVIDLIQLAWNREFHHRFISIFILWRPFNLTDASPNHFFLSMVDAARAVWNSPTHKRNSMDKKSFHRILDSGWRLSCWLERKCDDRHAFDIWMVTSDGCTLPISRFCLKI